MSSCWFDTIFFQSTVCVSKGFFCFLDVRAEFFTRLTAAKSFSQAVTADLQCRACRSSLGVFPSMCALLCINFFRLHFPTPSPFLGALKIPTVLSELESNMHIHICIHIWRDGGGRGWLFSQTVKEFTKPCTPLMQLYGTLLVSLFS